MVTKGEQKANGTLEFKIKTRAAGGHVMDSGGVYMVVVRLDGVDVVTLLDGEPEEPFVAGTLLPHGFDFLEIRVCHAPCWKPRIGITDDPSQN